MDRPGLPPRRRFHPGAVDELSGLPHRKGESFPAGATSERSVANSILEGSLKREETKFSRGILLVLTPVILHQRAQVCRGDPRGGTPLS